MAQNLPKTKYSTQDHLDIDDITEDLVILKTGWVSLILTTTAVNFDILSEAEQDATIYSYGAFLNSLSFPVQILIRSKKADITSYFQKIAEAEATQLNPDLKRQIQQYEDFLKSIVQQKTILDKKFYLIINYSQLEKGLRGIKSQNLTKHTKTQLIQDAKIALSPKRDHILKQTARLGLTTRQLTTQELIELFYDIYNPAPTGTQRVILDSASYTTPLVQPAIEIPSPAPVQQVSPAPGFQNPYANVVTPQNQIPQTQIPQVQKPKSQQDALKNLQEISNIARQMVDGQKPQSPPQNTSNLPQNIQREDEQNIR